MSWIRFSQTGALLLFLFSPTILTAASLHEEIDRWIVAGAGGAVAGPAADAEFVRRAWLDFAGRIPSAEESRAFLASADPNKRAALIDRLLASEDYPARMQEAISVMLLDRRDGKAIADDAWNRWLREAFAKNRPWNELVSEMIAADGADEASRPAIRFFVDGGRADAHTLTQDVARIFLGVNWQCAQCHDHPAFEDYKQAHYFGLYAFLNPSKVYSDKKSQTFFVESVSKAKVEFVSVFIPDDKRSTGPKLLDAEELPIPTFAAGEEFETPPKDGAPGVPRFRPRQLLARQLTSPQNRAFARNAVNRFWFLLMGRGIVHPLDLHHSGNPPSHPELLETLTDEFVAHNHDVKWLLCEIALSGAWQRSSVMPSDLEAKESSAVRYRAALPRALSAEQLARSLALATGRKATLDGASRPTDSKFTYKDYVNGRLPPPDNWDDVMSLFAAAFGHPAGQPEVDFRPSVEQSLFLTNDRLIASWLKEDEAGTVGQLLKITDDEKLADEAYLRFLSRLPEAEERQEVAAFVASGGDRPTAVRDLCRALLMSAEFRLNH